MKHRVNWKVLALLLILVVGIFMRVYQFPSYPSGLNQDEISEAYESYSLLTTGADRWGNHLPAYFLGWGSGQNVLQAYITIPVVAAFGLSPLSVRLVPLIIGIATLPLLFWVVRRITNTNTALMATLILAVCPWHVLLSRWGLESNILPFFLLLGVGAMHYALKAPKKHSWVILLSLLPFAVGFYAYGTSAVVIPVLILLMAAFSWRAIITRWRWWLGAAGIAVTIALPFVLFVLKNYVIHHALAIEHFVPFSIPLLEASRIDQIRGVATAGGLAPGDPLNNVLFIGNGFNDGSVYNVVGALLPLPLGVLLLSIAGVVVTVRDAIKTRGVIVSPFLLWLVSCIGLFFIAALNVNQANALFIPLIVLAAIAVTRIANLIKKPVVRWSFVAAIATSITVSGILGFSTYLSGANAQALATNYHPELASAFHEVQTINDGTTPIYITNSVALNYVQTLFYTHTKPAYFQSFHSTPDNPDFANFYFSADRLPTKKSFVFLINAGDDFRCGGQSQLLWHENDWQVGRCTRH